MGVYNGAAHLTEQLDSFTAQSHRDWQLIASDDGSSDDSPAILRAFAASQADAGRQVTQVRGPGQGFAVNFLSLIAAAPADAPWLALSDQDDVWLSDRIERGITALSAVPPDQPGLYCSRTWIVDEQLRHRRLSMDFRKAMGFENALVQNVVSGNTILLNRAAAELARAAAPEAIGIPGLPSHDWWLYMLITGAGGRVIRDPEPTLLYRQHTDNLLGANDHWRARAYRISMVLNGRFAAWTSANLAAMRASQARLTPANRALVENFTALRSQVLPNRILRFARSGIYRQSTPAQIALWLALVLGRL